MFLTVLLTSRKQITEFGSLKSTNLPAMIWPINLAGMGEKPGPTTNGWEGMKARTCSMTRKAQKHTREETLQVRKSEK